MQKELVFTRKRVVAPGERSATAPSSRSGRLSQWAAFASAGVLGCLVMMARAAEAPVVLTLLEGEATVVVGSRAFAAMPGARLGAGALIETEATAGLLRLEWPDGTVLDLGPATRVMLRAATLPTRGPLFYLLQGWAKQSQQAVSAGQSSPAFEVQAFKGVLVSHVDEGQATLFAESGSVSFVARRAGAQLSVRAGEAAVMAANGPPQIMSRPPAPWLKQLPRSFRETLPMRLEQFSKSAPPAWRARAPLTYTALQHWLVAEPAVRRDLPLRFADLLQDRSFKDSVVSRITQHPEWEPVLKPPRPGAVARKNTETQETEAPR
jgi:hypothetical protein